MKKLLLYYSLLLLLPVAISSCEKDNNNGFTVLVPEERVSHAGGTTTVRVLCDGPWYVETERIGEIYGLTISPMSGNGNADVRITFNTVNEDPYEFPIPIFFVSGTPPQAEIAVATVVQEPTPLIFAVNPSAMPNVGPEGIIQPFEVSCNVSFGLQVEPAEAFFWCHYPFYFDYPDENNITRFDIEIDDAGDITTPRTATLIFTCEYDGDTHQMLVPITQQPY